MNTFNSLSNQSGAEHQQLLAPSSFAQARQRIKKKVSKQIGEYASQSSSLRQREKARAKLQAALRPKSEGGDAEQARKVLAQAR